MRSKTREKAIELAERPYRLRYIKDETTDGKPMFAAEVVELEGCLGSGVTPEAAISDARKAMVDYIESLLEDGMPVPEPIQLLPVSYSSAGRVQPKSRVETTKIGREVPDAVDTEKPHMEATLTPA